MEHMESFENHDTTHIDEQFLDDLDYTDTDYLSISVVEGY